MSLYSELTKIDRDGRIAAMYRSGDREQKKKAKALIYAAALAAIERTLGPEKEHSDATT